jgi:CBS domain-containing protein
MPKCSEIMTRDPACCLPTDSIVLAAQIMRDKDVGSVPVVEDHTTKELTGIVTDRDLAIRAVAEGRNLDQAQVGNVMTRNPITCKMDDDLQQAIEAMEEHQVRRIPIIENGRRLVGIIAQADVALKVENPEQTAEVVEEISKPA